MKDNVWMEKYRGYIIFSIYCEINNIHGGLIFVVQVTQEIKSQQTLCPRQHLQVRHAQSVTNDTAGTCQ
jgi:hypothetical protein